MIITQGRGREVIVRHRDDSRQRIVTKINDGWPYYFVRTEDADVIPAIRKEDGYRGVFGEDLTKITVATPDIVYQHKKDFPHLDTWEANIPFVNRVLADRVKAGETPFKNYEHRVWYLDCEWNPTTNKMRMIVAHDSYTDNKYVWFICPEGQPLPVFKAGISPKPCTTEGEMLQDFVTTMRRDDPDIITGWYVTGADVKNIVERCRVSGVNASEMSPNNYINYNFGDWAQPISGRLCIDLMLGFSKLWELKNGKLPGYNLDGVAKEVLGEQKVELPDGHDTYYSDFPLYVNYCIQDVDLLPKLDAKVNAIDYYLALQHLVQCDIRTTPYITKMFACLTMADKECNFQIPTKPQFEHEDYDGANVMDVEPGLYPNVGILDVKAMYHSNASLHNISWDTLDESDERECNYEDCGNGTYFYKGKKGLLVRQMDNMTDLRNKFKKLMKTDPDNYDRWDTMQYACKSLVASMYGVAGDSKFGLYHPKIASAITYTSRVTLDRLKEEAEKVGFSVLYGHTDSVFCTIPSAVYGEEKVVIINEEMAPIEVQFEKWCSSMLLVAKNRYAANVVWTDGIGHEDTLYVKGIEMKQSRMPPIMKSTMTELIHGILASIEETEMNEILIPIIDKVVRGDIDDADLCMKGKLTRNLSDYKVLSGPSAGAAWANEYLGKGYHDGSFFKVTIDESGNYIAFDDPSEIEGIVKIGYEIMCERFIINKVEPYYKMMGWDMQPLHNALRGLGSLAWL